MSFLEYQNKNPEFLNNYLKYNRYISFEAQTTVDGEYFDLRTYFRYIKLINFNDDIRYSMSAEDFRKLEIKDVTLEQVSNIKPTTINDFTYFLRYTLDNGAKARNRKLSSVKKFYEYLANNNFITYNPTANSKSARIEKRQPKYLNLQESKKMLSVSINSDCEFKIRNYAITCLFLNCSIRLAELIGIDLVDIKLDEKTLKVKGKGNVERIIYLDDAACEAISEYLKVRPNLPKTNIDCKALFISKHNKRISRRTVQHIIENELYATFGEKREGFHTHTLRHSSATLMYNENDTNIFILKKILGHKSIAATEIYTHVSSKKMKDIMENCTISSILAKKEEK